MENRAVVRENGAAALFFCAVLLRNGEISVLSEEVLKKYYCIFCISEYDKRVSGESGFSGSK